MRSAEYNWTGAHAQEAEAEIEPSMRQFLTSVLRHRGKIAAGNISDLRNVTPEVLVPARQQCGTSTGGGGGRGGGGAPAVVAMAGREVSGAQERRKKK